MGFVASFDQHGFYDCMSTEFPRDIKAIVS